MGFEREELEERMYYKGGMLSELQEAGMREKVFSWARMEEEMGEEKGRAEGNKKLWEWAKEWVEEYWKIY